MAYGHPSVVSKSVITITEKGKGNPTKKAEVTAPVQKNPTLSAEVQMWALPVRSEW
jgi:hypothetical protein